MSFPSPEQEDVIKAAIENRSSLLIVAGPGGGKSRTAIEIARRMLACIDERKQVLFLSFSNATIRRLSEASGADGALNRRRLVFATYHSLAAEVLGSYGQFVGLPGRTKVMDNLEERFIAIENGWDDSDRETYRGALFAHAKKTGELAFRTLVPLAAALLQCCPTLTSAYFGRFALIVVDEFQDTSKDQWDLLKAIGGNKQVLAFGDPNQIIYASLHDATEERLKEFEEWKGVKQVTLPPVSHRCKEDDILSFASCLLMGKQYDSPETEQSPVKIVDLYPDQLVAALAAYCLGFLSKTKQAKLGILVPRNKLADEIVYRLRHPNPEGKIRSPVYARLPQDPTAIESIQLVLAALLDYAQKRTPSALHTAVVALCTMNNLWNPQAGTSPQNVAEIRRCFVSTRMKKNNLAQLPEIVAVSGISEKERAKALIEFLQGKSIFEVAARRIQQNYPTSFPAIPEPLPGASLFETIRVARKPKGLEGDDAGNNRIQVLTYQRSKGREFDVVVMVVDKYAESSGTPLQEKRRLYYVCATRAKRRFFVIHFGKIRTGNVLGPVLYPTYIEE